MIEMFSRTEKKGDSGSSDNRFAETAREVAAQIAIGAAERDRERRYPSEQLKIVRESGLEAVLVPAGLRRSERNALRRPR